MKLKATLWAALMTVCLTALGEADPLRAERKRLQSLELIPARSYSFIFNAGEPPKIVWRDLEEARQLGLTKPLRVRWFDADLNESQKPDRPGRWAAYIETTAPNGLPLRRAMTFYCRPKGFFLYLPRGLKIELPHESAPVDPQVWQEHRDELTGAANDMLMRGFNDSEAGAVLLAWLSETKPVGRPPRSFETAAARNEQFQLDVKLQVQGLESQVKRLPTPRKREGKPAQVLRHGTAAEAGVRDDAREKIDAVCRAWAEDSGEPFVTLVARRGVIITHEAFGTHLDYRADVASITKSITAILFARFLDQGRIELDDPISKAFADYPKNDPHVPTFRQCLTHTSGLSGHGEFGGVRNAHFENIVLNAIDATEPGKKYEYTGMGFELVGKAMEILSGKSFVRLAFEDLFEPLGLGDLPMASASSGARPTALQLATLAQLFVNRGSYGEEDYFSQRTFESLLPQPLDRFYPGIPDIEGIGVHWMHPRRPGAPPDSTQPEHLYFSQRMIGHGSLSASIFLVDLEQELIIVQIRREPGKRHSEWVHRFYQAMADVLHEAHRD